MNRRGDLLLDAVIGMALVGITLSTILSMSRSTTSMASEYKSGQALNVVHINILEDMSKELSTIGELTVGSSNTRNAIYDSLQVETLINVQETADDGTYIVELNSSVEGLRNKALSTTTLLTRNPEVR